MADASTHEIEPFLVPLDGPSERVRAIVEPALAADGVELILLEVRRKPRSTTVRVFIDEFGEETVGVGTLERTNRMLGDLLDVEDAHEGLFPGTWDLEVSSPGVDRPLAKRSHFEAARGQTVKIKARTLEGTRMTVRGKLQEVGETSVTLDADNEGAVTFAFEEINDANIIFEFGETEKPEPKRKKKSSGKPRG